MIDKPNPLLKVLYGMAVVTALFSGFGNMPLWKRYYVADVPGLGWSGNFFINVNVHILAGSLLLAIGIYLITRGSRTGKLTFSGRIRCGLMVLTLATGMLMVVKNLPGVYLPMPALMAFNFAHMGAAVLFMFVALLALIFRQPWIRRP